MKPNKKKKWKKKSKVSLNNKNQEDRECKNQKEFGKGYIHAVEQWNKSNNQNDTTLIVIRFDAFVFMKCLQ